MKWRMSLGWLGLLLSWGALESQESSSPKTPSEVTVENSKQFWVPSKEVDDRFLMKVFLPESYFTHPARTYPVVYLSDGDRYFGLASDLVFHQLHREDIDVVLVGIGYGSRALNDQKRNRDLNGQGEAEVAGSDRFLSFLQRELIPDLEKRFRFDPTKRTLAGWSRGAVFALQVLFEAPDLFQNYLVLSPRFSYEGWSAFEMEAAYAKKNEDLRKQVYLSIGDQDERHADFPAFVEALTGRNYAGLSLESTVFPGWDHDMQAYSLGFASGLKHFFELEGIDRVLEATLEAKDLEFAIAEYHRLKKASPEVYDFGEARLNILGYQLLGQDKIIESIAIFRLNVEVFPDSFNVYDSLGEAYWMAGEKELALENYRKSVELNPDNQNGILMIEKIMGGN